MKRRFFCFLLAVVMCSLAFSMNIGAFMNGDLSPDEGAKIFQSTAAEALKEQQKYNTAAAELISPLRYDPEGILITLSVPVYQQETNYWCGPATVKQVVQFLKGTSQSQSYYAQQLATSTSGTNMTDIASYLKNNINSNYSMVAIGTYGQWLVKVTAGIQAARPSVLDIETTGSSVWPYSSSGHFVNTSGVDTKNIPPEKVRITDPYGPGLGNRWYSAADLYAVNNAHWRQSIIW